MLSDDENVSKALLNGLRWCARTERIKSLRGSEGIWLVIAMRLDDWRVPGCCYFTMFKV